MAKRGPKPKQISKEVQDIILALIETGESDRRVRKITCVRPEQWIALAATDDKFRALLESAKEQRHGGLARTLRQSMVAQIKKGHPWWAKLAIHNFRVLLRDPDVVGAAKIKKLLAEAKPDDPRSYVEVNPSVASASPPPGAVPPLAK